MSNRRRYIHSSCILSTDDAASSTSTVMTENKINETI